MATPPYLSGTDEIEPQDLIAVWSSRNRDTRRVSAAQFSDSIADRIENDLLIAVASANDSADIARAAAASVGIGIGPLVDSAVATALEPTSALIASLQAQIDELAEALQGATPLPYLRGVNYLSYGGYPGSQLPRTEATDYYIGKGVNVFRLALEWEYTQPVLGSDLAISPRLENVRLLADDYKARGAYLIVDLHNYMRRTVDGVQYIVGETPTVTAAHLADLWSKLAGYLKDKTNVIWGLMNEPHDQDDAILVSTTNLAIKAIRATGSRHPVFVCPNQWNTAGWRAGSNNPVFMLNVVDSANKLFFDIHHYFDSYSAGQSSEVIAESEWKEGLVNATNWARSNGRKLFCGEFAYPQTSAGMAAGRSFHEFLVANQDVWVGWCHLGAGGWWPYDYLFRLDPYGSRYDNNNPWKDGALGGSNNATTWTPINDQLSMSLLETYLPNTKVVNLVPHSRYLLDNNPYHVGLNASQPVIANAADGVFGKATNQTGLFAVRESGAAGQHLYGLDAVSITPNKQYTASILLKQGATVPGIQIQIFAADYSAYAAGVFLQSGLFQFSFTGGTGVEAGNGIVQDQGNGEYLFALPFKLNSTGARLRILGRHATNADSYAGTDGAVMFYLDHIQINEGATPLAQKITDLAPTT